MTKPLGLTAALSKALREHVDQQLDMLLTEAEVEYGQSGHRDMVDAVRRWAERREEALFPTGRDEHGRVGLTPEQYRARVEAQSQRDEQVIANEPTNGHGKELCPECGQQIQE